MDSCHHIKAFRPSTDHSILSPEKWACCVCGTTESVWACLSCSYVACGRYIAEHALQHYNDTRHPLAFEVNDRYLYCYECGDYILNDNETGDIETLRCCLHAISTSGRLSPSQVKVQDDRLLRSCSVTTATAGFYEGQMKDEDRNYTALLFRRYHVLANMFRTWRTHVQEAKTREQGSRKRSSTGTIVGGTSGADDAVVMSGFARLRLTHGGIVPGMTGLRNLGNTCYMNSILQVLSNMIEFRDFFLRRSERPGNRFVRQSTIECYEHVNSTDQLGGIQGNGLQGGMDSNSQVMFHDGDALTPRSVCTELSALLRVMWSGKWAIVSPHQMLYAVWATMPFFKGYVQHDAQEFLSEFLDRIDDELSNESKTSSRPASTTMVTRLFQGELASQVRCVVCGNCSMTFEPFTDLSLDFPEQYHSVGDLAPLRRDSCHVTDLLEQFVRVERLDGPVYTCESCNANRDVSQPPIKSDAEKCMLLSRMAPVLRLHLKRFMWGGRNSRGKISAHVQFDERLDLTPFCSRHAELESTTLGSRSKIRHAGVDYRLTAVVMHHGTGFVSGHYTAYCWNHIAESWVHCNDSTVTPCHFADVQRAQAYILVYTSVAMLDKRAASAVSSLASLESIRARRELNDRDNSKRSRNAF